MKQALVICSIVALAINNPASATECAHHPSDDGSWTWRMIDGDKCWYRGHHVRSKSELHWAKAPSQDPPKAPPSWLERVSEHAAPAEIYFPALVSSNMIEAYPRMIWPQPWLSSDSMLHWPVLLDIDRRPFTTWNKRIGE